MHILFHSNLHCILSEWNNILYSNVLHTFFKKVMHYFIMCTLYILHTIFAALVAILNILFPVSIQLCVHLCMSD